MSMPQEKVENLDREKSGPLFGENSPQQGMSNPNSEGANALGLTDQAPIQPPEGQDAGQPDSGQPAQQQQTAAPAEGQGQQGQPEEGPGENQQQDTGASTDEAPEKFRNPDGSIDRKKLVQSLEELGKKFGKKFNREATENYSIDQLMEIYRNGEQELGATSDIDQTRQEIQQIREEREQLKQQNEMLKQSLQQYLAQQQNHGQQAYQNTQMPPGQYPVQGMPQQQHPGAAQQAPQQPQNAPAQATRPYTNQYGQWPQNQQSQAPQGQEQQGQSDTQQATEDIAEKLMDEIDVTKLLDEREGPRIISRAVAKAADEVSEQKVQAKIQELEERRRQEEQVRQWQEQQRRAKEEQNRRYRQYLNSEIKRLQQTYGEDFEAHREGASQILRMNPNLAMQRGGLEHAYRQAKAMGLRSSNPNSSAGQGQTQTTNQSYSQQPQQSQQTAQQQPQQTQQQQAQAQNQQQQNAAQQQIQAQKRAARMPQSQAKGQPGRQMSQEEIEKRMLFSPTSNQGVFG